MVAVPAIWLFTALVLTLFGVVMFIGFMYLILFAVFYVAVRFIIKPIIRATGGGKRGYD